MGELRVLMHHGSMEWKKDMKEVAVEPQDLQVEGVEGGILMMEIGVEAHYVKHLILAGKMYFFYVHCFYMSTWKLCKTEFVSHL